MEEGNKFTQSLEIFETLRFIDKKKRLHQKLMLDAIENQIHNPEDFKVVRKVILDNTSELTRSILRAILGDTFEGMVK